MKTGEDYFKWTEKHDAHLKVRRSIANIGVVMGQSTQLLYSGPWSGAFLLAHSTCTRRPRESTTRCCEAGTRFDYVHEDRHGAGEAHEIPVLLLPNIAMLSDRQCEQLRAYAQGRRIVDGQF